MKLPTRDNLLAELKEIYFDPDCVLPLKYNDDRIVVEYREPYKGMPLYNLLDEDKLSYVYITLVKDYKKIIKAKILVTLLQRKHSAGYDKPSEVDTEKYSNIKELAKAVNKAVMKELGLKLF